MPTLDWIGKQAVVNHHREVPYRLVHCDSDLSAGDPNAGNLLVHGDNLEALRALLPYYAGKVKCIYIDPPYNTGNEGWIYNDNVNSPEIREWLGRVVGKEAEDLSRHDKWLCMMYPRLRLLKEFLSDDGSIWVSIDDKESHYLKALMDSIFGRSNFLTNLVWQKIYTTKNSAKNFSDMHEHILVYSKEIGQWQRNEVPRSHKQDKAYTNDDDDVRGPWKATPVHARNYYSKGSYVIKSPNGREITPPNGTYWRFSEDKFQSLCDDDRIWWGKSGENIPAQKRFLSEVQAGLVPTTWWSYQDAGHNAMAKNEIRALFDADGLAFLTPKPEKLIERILTIATNKGDFVLDSFLGSGTTAAVAHKMDRKYIGIEMTPIAESHCAMRLKKVIDGEDGGVSQSQNWKGGRGFRFCRLGVPLFDEFGDVADEVTFPDLAAHIFFSETGVPIPKKADSEFLGTFQERAVYLLFDAAHQQAPRAAASNVLTPDRLDALPPAPANFEGKRVVYAEGCTVSKDRLRSAGVIFKQIPYQIDGV